MGKIYCTFSDYEKFCEVFEAMYYKANCYVPTMEEITERIQGNEEEYILYLLWILETGEETEDNRECRQKIRELVNKHFSLVDKVPEETGENTK